MTRRRSRSHAPLDLGDSWYVDRDVAGSATVYSAMLLNEPGGYVVGGYRRTFSYRRDAIAWVAEVRDAPEVAAAREAFAAWLASPAGVEREAFNARLRASLEAIR